MVNKKAIPFEELVLNTINEITSSPHKSTVSTIEVAERMSCSLLEVKLAFQNLSKSGHIEIDESFQYATPIKKGVFQKNKNIDSTKLEYDPLAKNILKVVGGAFITAVVAFIIWYFGLSPNSTNILPFSFGNPIQIYSSHYDDGFYDLVWSYWNVDDVNRMVDNFNQDNQFFRYPDSASDATKVTINGFVTLTFDVENSAKFSQANLVEINIEARRESFSQLAEIYQTPPTERGGAGIPMDYEATIDLGFSDSTKETQTFLAKPSSDQVFEFITLAPGERETINVFIILPKPGFYQLTPIARFNYEDKHYEHQFETLEVIFPQKYRVWFVSERGMGNLSSNNFTVGRTVNGIYVENLIQQSYPEKLSFNSSLGALNALYVRNCKKFVITGDYVTSSSNAISECTLSNTIPQQPISPEIQTLLANMYNNDISDVAISPVGDNLAIVLINESQQNNFFRSGNIVIFNQVTFEITEIFPSTVWCDSPVWSPTGRNLAFLCRPGNGFETTELWIKDISGKTFTIQLDPKYQYQDPTWSEDEIKLLLGGDGLWVISAVPPNNIIQIFDILDCNLCIENPEFEK